MAMNPERMIHEAKIGGNVPLGQLLEGYRAYLRFISRIEIGRQLQGKVDASDLVQETFLDAHRHFDRFRGKDESQLVRWLRQILSTKISNVVRHYYGTQGRDVRLEQNFEFNPEDSTPLPGHGFAATLSTPSQHASQREQVVLLAEALERLPEDYREVIVLRHIEELTFPQVSERMGRTQDSVQKLWLRALARLRQVFGEAQ